ncbi:MAG TPA: V-type ATP synthase subunit A [Spirochaetia bacterium]|nr:V-type ATP synthase subunit A [Spirochaetia bacterium]
MIEGKVVRINGPIIKATGLGGSGLYDVVEIGEKRLIGEIIRLEGDSATIQIYEDNTGMRVGESAWSLERPLSVHLGPGLLGQIYDGIQRPLTEIKRISGGFINPGVKIPPLSTEKKWHFVASAKAGETPVPGTIVGEVRESATIVHKVAVPPEFHSSKIEWVAPEGDYTITDTILRFAGGRQMSMSHFWPVRKARPYVQKMSMDEPLVTGQRVIDVLFPISRGGTSAIPGGFGTGKTMTQHALAKWCDADIIVYIGCGERGNEMTDVLTEFPRIQDPRTGKSLMERTVLIANTSNMPVAAREVSIYTGVTLAEYYRDMGYDVAIMADSTSRWAEALRELSGRLEEMPADEGFPAYLPTRLAEFYERAGKVTTLGDRQGSISVIGAVSPPGGDFSEPVTQHTKRFIRCFWALDRELANARHYPAISWIDSYSEYAEEIRGWWEKVNPDWNDAREKAIELLKREQRLSQIVKLIGPDALPDNQRLILVTAEMIKNGFLQQNAYDEVDMFCVPDKQVRILKLMMDFHARALSLIQMGAPLLKIRELSCLERIVRARSTIRNEELAKFAELEELLAREMDDLERSYKK